MKYVPVLKWKKGEKLALKYLSAEHKNMIKPLFEIYDQDEPEDFIQDLNEYYEDQVYIDTLYIDEGDRSYILSIFNSMEQTSRNDHPVVYYEDINNIADELFEKAEKALFRIPVPIDIDGPEIGTILNSIKECCQRNNVNIDLMFDAGEQTGKRDIKYLFLEFKDIFSTLNQLDAFYESIIISLTCFPKSLGNIAAGGSLIQERFEIDFYLKILSLLEKDYENIRPEIIFSDYGVAKFTETEIDFALMKYPPLPKTKYTTENSYWILKGQRDRTSKQWIKNYDDLAKEIVNSDVYCGEDFSYGDLKIKQKAYGLEGEGPGNHGDWVTICTNHHIAVVLEQLSKIREI
ncbi:MAG: hypothetical protein PWR10_1833 [Halanaerobiales bacterium]|nr:hypothetical protein [Halanaerobiales bacterium]